MCMGSVFIKKTDYDRANSRETFLIVMKWGFQLISNILVLKKKRVNLFLRFPTRTAYADIMWDTDETFCLTASKLLTHGSKQKCGCYFLQKPKYHNIVIKLHMLLCVRILCFCCGFKLFFLLPCFAVISLLPLERKVLESLLNSESQRSSGTW